MCSAPPQPGFPTSYHGHAERLYSTASTLAKKPKDLVYVQVRPNALGKISYGIAPMDAPPRSTSEPPPPQPLVEPLVRMYQIGSVFFFRGILIRFEVLQGPVFSQHLIMNVFT